MALVGTAARSIYALETINEHGLVVQSLTSVERATQACTIYYNMQAQLDQDRNKWLSSNEEHACQM